MPVNIELCCNDPDDGNPLDYSEAVELFDCSLVGARVRTDWKPERLPRAWSAEGDTTLRIGRLLLPCLYYKCWYGNWCWDMAKVRLIHAVAIWNYLAAKPNWHCEEGPEELCKLFNAHGKIDPRTAPEFLARILQHVDAARKGGLAK